MLDHADLNNYVYKLRGEEAVEWALSGLQDRSYVNNYHQLIRCEAHSRAGKFLVHLVSGSFHLVFVFVHN